MAELNVIEGPAKCNFCGFRKNDYLKYGPMYKLGNIKAHYFCVLLSNRLIQNGSDEEGILGFVLPDILSELKRTSNVSCTYCKKKNATIQCSFKSCRKSFHLPCGLQKKSCHQFYNQFKSFCHTHAFFQNIPEKIFKEALKTRVMCCICHEEVDVKNKSKTLWAPCCMKTWYHRLCLQQLAYSAGYFFKCAACNDVRKFNKHMQQFGVFVPQQDASWERVPNAFSELLFRYGTCDADICRCPDGRQKNATDTEWEVVVCCTCGSQGVHVSCGNLKYSDVDWECSSCEKITTNMQSSTVLNDSTKEDAGSSKLVKSVDVNYKKRRRTSDDIENLVLDKKKRSRITVEEDDEEAEVDIETVEEEKGPEPKQSVVNEKVNDVDPVDVWNSSKTDFQEILSLLKPGPLSYKLSVIQKTCQAKLAPFEKLSGLPKKASSPPLIDLVEEDVEVIEVINHPQQKVKEEVSGVASISLLENFSYYINFIKKLSEVKLNSSAYNPMAFILPSKRDSNAVADRCQPEITETVADDKNLPGEESEVAIIDSKPKNTEVELYIPPAPEREDEVIVCEIEAQKTDTPSDNDVIFIDLFL